MPYKDREKRNQWFKEKMRNQRLDPLFRLKENSRRRKGNDQKIGICEVCGFSEVFDVHHEDNQTHILCPNHHALITRGKKTLADMLNKPSVIPNEAKSTVIPNETVIPKQAKLAKLRQLIANVKSEQVAQTEPMQSKLPICNEYNFRQFKPGDRVMVRRGKRLMETTIPELDADGHPVPAW